jgi:hypothetical protein
MQTTRFRRWMACACLLLVVGVLWSAPVAHAEALPLRLSLQRLNGADLLGHVSGTFRLTAEGPDNVRSVTFYLDGRILGRATTYPFSYGLDTGDFPKGEHEIEAVAQFTDGAVATSNTISLQFRSRNWHLAVRQSMFLYAGLVPVLGVVGALIVRNLLHIQPRLVLLDR